MALDADGVDDEITHGDISGMSAATLLTIMLWYMPDELVNLEPIISKWASNVGWTLQVSGTSGAFRVAFGNWTPNGLTGNLLSVGTWAHLAFVYNGGGATDADKVKLYHNGVNQSLTFAGTIPASLGSTTDPLRAANMGASGVSFHNMKAALVKLWLAELTAAEVAQESHSFRPARTTNLSLWSPYDDATSAKDYSGLGNHGTVTGALQAAGPPIGYGRPVPVLL